MAQEDTIQTINLEMRCPICHIGELIMIYKVSLIPYFGGIVLLTIKCNNCGLKITDVVAVSEKGNLPEKYEVKTYTENLGDLLVLSSGSKIEIPELDIELDITGEQGGEITTLEGLITNIIDMVKILLNDSEDKTRKKVISIISTLKHEKEKPSGSLTIILKDENRRSAVIPNDIWTKKAEDVRTQMMLLDEKSVRKIGQEIAKEKLEK